MHLGAMRHPLRQLQQFCSLAAATTAATTAATLGQASERRIQGQEPTGSMAVWGGVGNAVSDTGGQGAWINVKLCVKTLGLTPLPDHCW